MEENIQTEVMKERKMSRTVDASPERTFQAWTDPLELRTWWGPRGFTTGEVLIEPREGGRFSVEMEDEAGRTFPMRGNFQKFEGPSRLVFTTSIIDDPAGGRPLEALNTVTFEERGEGTEIIWRWEAIDPAPTDIVAAAIEGYERTVSDSLSRLAELMSRTSGQA
jgi:uncharacterized protein YndB with AHSA1/START domain